MSSNPSTPHRSSRIGHSQQSSATPRTQRGVAASTPIAMASDDVDMTSSPLRYPSSPGGATPRADGRVRHAHDSQLNDNDQLVSSQAGEFASFKSIHLLFFLFYVMVLGVNWIRIGDSNWYNIDPIKHATYCI